MADITADAIDKLLSLAPVERFEIHDLEYTSKSLNLTKLPSIALVKVITLSSLVALFQNDFENIQDDKSIFHVTDEKTVEVYDNESNSYGQRTHFATASFGSAPAFKFDTWLEQEQFIIGLQAHFVPSLDDDHEYCRKLASSIELSDKLKVEDNGTHQNVTAKVGMSLTEDVTVKPRVKLSPYRTFREILQPPSEFVLRIRKGARGGPELALFEADGGEWKLDAMEYIHAFLAEKLGEAKLATVIH